MNHNEQLFDRFEGLTFDDVVLVPGFSDVLPDQVDTATTFARDIVLSVPLVSAAMDRVTEARLAIAMARCGGLGVVHRNLTVEDQAAEVQKVKRSQSGMISDPVTLPATATLDDAEQLMNRFKISGVPITNRDGVLVGILTNRDVRFCSPDDYKRPVSDFMTSEGLVTAPEGTTLEQAKKLLQQHRIEKLPLVDAKERLRGLITVKDIMKRQEFPNATRDSSGRLRVAAAVGVGEDLETRVEALARVGVDAVVIDTAHGNSMGVVKAIERVKASWPELAVVAGNVVDEGGVETLHGAGADAVKIGVGAGSICTTRVVAGVGIPQMTALYVCARAAAEKKVTILADGGITKSGDIVKALTLAQAVICGGVLAGCAEAPGEILEIGGKLYKQYRGMGSLAAMKAGSAARYGHTSADTTRKVAAEGIEALKEVSGSVDDVLANLIGGVQSGMGYLGAGTLTALREKARFIRVSPAGQKEAAPHDVIEVSTRTSNG